MVRLNSKITIHLNKLEGNLNAIKSRLRSGVKVMAVVKDEAYGHGLIKIAEFLQHKVDWFCVVFAEEGKVLRESGIKNPVLVFETPQKNKLGWYKEFGLTASVADPDVIELLEAGTDFHVNFDTGMHRLGVLPHQVDELKKKIESRPDLNHTGLYTHFFKSEIPEAGDTSDQLEVFKSIISKFRDDLYVHTSNSGGVFSSSHQDLQFDGVRPGISLYGYEPGEALIDDINPIIDWSSFLMQVKPIKKGETVSYGGRWEAPEDGFIGVVPVGYGHGLFRILSNKIKVLIGERYYPQIGTITMDFIMIDLGQDMPEPGTEVFLLKGNDLTAGDWARKAGTIPYEIVTFIKESLVREYKD